MASLVIFSAPKPFTDAHIRLIQTNAIRSWQALGEQVEIILIGEEAGLAEAAMELGVRRLPKVERNAYGTPLVNSLFDLARENSHSPLLLFVNTDILLLPPILEAACAVAEQKRTFLIVGQRWDLDVGEALDFSPGWDDRLMRRARTEGRLHGPTGSDYFIFPRDIYTNLPPLAIGRAGWDNWMIYKARSEGWPVVDASDSIPIIHQNHHYAHLPGGKPHYHLPESDENVRLGGGRRTIFTLLDADFLLEGLRVVPARLAWRKFWREVELFPLLRLKSKVLAHAFFVMFHPIKAWGMLRGWAQYKVRSIK